MNKLEELNFLRAQYEALYKPTVALPPDLLDGFGGPNDTAMGMNLGMASSANLGTVNPDVSDDTAMGMDIGTASCANLGTESHAISDDGASSESGGFGILTQDNNTEISCIKEKKDNNTGDDVDELGGVESSQHAGMGVGQVSCHGSCQMPEGHESALDRLACLEPARTQNSSASLSTPHQAPACTDGTTTPAGSDLEQKLDSKPARKPNKTRKPRKHGKPRRSRKTRKASRAHLPLGHRCIEIMASLFRALGLGQTVATLSLDIESDELAADASLTVKEMQNFIDRWQHYLATRLNDPRSGRRRRSDWRPEGWFVISNEHDDGSCRLHIYIIITNWPGTGEETLRELWGHGEAKINIMTPDKPNITRVAEYFCRHKPTGHRKIKLAPHRAAASNDIPVETKKSTDSLASAAEPIVHIPAQGVQASTGAQLNAGQTSQTPASMPSSSPATGLPVQLELPGFEPRPQATPSQHFLRMYDRANLSGLLAAIPPTQAQPVAAQLAWSAMQPQPVASMPGASPVTSVPAMAAAEPQDAAFASQAQQEHPVTQEPSDNSASTPAPSRMNDDRPGPEDLSCSRSKGIGEPSELSGSDLSQTIIRAICGMPASGDSEPSDADSYIDSRPPQPALTDRTLPLDIDLTDTDSFSEFMGKAKCASSALLLGSCTDLVIDLTGPVADLVSPRLLSQTSPVDTAAMVIMLLDGYQPPRAARCQTHQNAVRPFLTEVIDLTDPSASGPLEINLTDVVSRQVVSPALKMAPS